MKVEKVRVGYLAYELDSASRAQLLEVFPPRFPDVIAHHITIQYGVAKPADDQLGERVSINVVGHAEDDSLEALVVEVLGRMERPDGKTYHCTWSLDRSKGRKPVQSNGLIKAAGFELVERPITVSATLRFFY